MLKRSLGSAQSLCVEWPDMTQSILGDEVFKNQEEMIMNNASHSDRFANENDMDLLLHSSLCDLEPDFKVLDRLEEPYLMSSPESSCKKSRSTPSTPSKTSVSNSFRRRKKPRGMPKRPLSAYNIFFQTQRTVVQAQSRKEQKAGSKGLGFEGLGKLIGKQWQKLGKEQKKKYEELAEKDSTRYRQEMNEYNRKKKEVLEKEKSRHLTSSAIGVESTTCKKYPKFVISRPNSTNTSPFSMRGVDRAGDLMKLACPLDFNVSKACASNELGGNPPENPSQPLPIVPPAVDNAGNFLFPPGMEIMLSDSTGRERKYLVDYKCYKMSRAQATRFIDSVAGNFRSCEEGHPGIPQGSIEVPYTEVAQT